MEHKFSPFVVNSRRVPVQSRYIALSYYSTNVAAWHLSQTVVLSKSTIHNFYLDAVAESED